VIKRQINQELIDLAAAYRIVTITGPRQTGKTTLVRTAFPTYTYVSLEDPDVRALATNDPRAFLALYSRPVIFDEIQRVPMLLSYIQTIVDNDAAKGQFILTGSHQLELSEAITQSLAGRTALLTLYPLSFAETPEASALSVDEHLYRGFLPAVHAENLNPTRFYRNYFQTYVERDVRKMLQVKDLVQFENFMRLCAGRVGQLLNASSIATEVGVSVHTIQNWFSILEASYLVIRLPPYHANLGKRLIKTPKLYFTDVGLATYLLGVESIEHIQHHPIRGSLFENMVIMELIKARTNKGLDPNLFFYRDANGNEIDVLFRRGTDAYPIEIKSAMTYQSGFRKGLDYYRHIDPRGFKRGFVIYAGDLLPESEDVSTINFRNSAQALEWGRALALSDVNH